MAVNSGFVNIIKEPSIGVDSKNNWMANHKSINSTSWWWWRVFMNITFDVKWSWNYYKQESWLLNFDIYMFLVSEIVSENISGPINDIRTFCESQQTNWNVWDEEESLSSAMNMTDSRRRISTMMIYSHGQRKIVYSIQKSYAHHMSERANERSCITISLWVIFVWYCKVEWEACEPNRMGFFCCCCWPYEIKFGVLEIWQRGR